MGAFVRYRQFIVSSALALLSGCATLGEWGGEETIALVAVEAPRFCERLVVTRSDAVAIRPDYQTVIAQDCPSNDALATAPVVWVSMERGFANEERLAAGKPATREVPVRALQAFERRGKKTAMKEPSRNLKDFALVAKAKAGPVRVVGYMQTSAEEKQVRANAQRVADWLVKQGVDRARIQVGTRGAQDTASRGVVAAEMTLVVTGG